MMFPFFDPSHMAWMMVGTAVFCVALAGAVIIAIGRVVAPPPGPDAVAILRERLARGEITPEEFQSRRGLVSSR